MYKFDELKEKTLKEEELYVGKLLHVLKATVELPNGEQSTREFIRHIGAVGIVPLTDDGKVIIERQFRYPKGDVITEIPAGKLDSKDEDRLKAAQRELLEETGITADEWISLGDYCPALAYCDERITIYLAKGLHEGQQDLDEDEFLNIEKVPLIDLLKEVLDGSITDGKTQVAIMKAAVLEGIMK